MRKKIAVFGSAQAKPGADAYATALAAGQAIANAGFDLLCGGYGGVMEAACKGCRAEGGTCYGIGLTAFGTVPNEYIHEFQTAETLAERLGYFTKHAGACLALDGGIGTITEIMYFWDLAKGGLIQDVPLILYGKQWQELLAVLKSSFIIKDEAYGLLSIVETTAELKQILLEKR